MKKLLTSLVLTAAGLVALPSTIRAEDSIPPTPPGAANLPAPATSQASPAPASSPTTPERPGGRRAGGGGGPGERLEMMKEKLGLTPEQVEKLKPIFEKDREKAKAVREDSALGEDQKRAKMRELMKSATEEMKAILTPEQQAKFREGMEKRREEMEKRGEK